MLESVLLSLFKGAMNVDIILTTDWTHGFYRHSIIWWLMTLRKKNEIKELLDFGAQSFLTICLKQGWEAEPEKQIKCMELESETRVKQWGT